MTSTSSNIAEPIAHLAVAIDLPQPYDRNPRRGNVEGIAESLRINGQYRPIVVNKRGNIILAGNHTWRAAKELGWSEIAVTWVDVDDDTARRIVLVDNRANDVAEYDDRLLAEILAEAAEADNLVGTGYDPYDLDKLADSLRNDEPPGEFPEVDGDVATEHRCPQCGYEWSGKSK